jgi:geranylgeranyl pyrophosphate synthase
VSKPGNASGLLYLRLPSIIFDFMPDLSNFFSDVRRAIDQTLDIIVPSEDVEPVRLYQAIRWSLYGEGKRFRPALVVAAGRVFGADDADLLRTAAAVELIHTYSLIHDDLPAMDDDDLRRGRATVHKKFDESTAILAGDALQAMAFQAIADDICLTSDVRTRLLSDLTSAAAKMVDGQQLDLEAERKTLSIDGLEQIHLKKTGALISFSVKAGALIAAAPDAAFEALGEYGLKLGLLFQITDDILDVTQPTEILGKTASKDVASEKATYPRLFGLAETRNIAGTVHRQALAALRKVDADTKFLEGIADFILDRNS